jgi:uncharacterized protein (TIGR02452 family)
MYGDNKKPFYLLLPNVVIKATGDTRDFICVPAPLAPRKRSPCLYEDINAELELRISAMCKAIGHYPTFITGAWGCGFFGNKFEDVEHLFKKHATNQTVVMAIK